MVKVFDLFLAQIIKYHLIKIILYYNIYQKRDNNEFIYLVYMYILNKII